MGREVSYEDAVKLLGGDTAKIVKLVDTLTGVGLLALVGPFKDILGWFDAKAELSKITEHLVTALAEKRSKLSRYERTERLQAAHAALALTAFFEAMAEADWPYRDLELTAAEQRSLGSVSGRTHAGAWRAPVPEPAESHPEFRRHLLDYYRLLVPRVEDFAAELAFWERLDEQSRSKAAAVLEGVPPAAVARFDSLLGRLAADFPEVAFWAGMREQAAVQARLRQVTTGLVALREVLAEIAGDRVADERRRQVAAAYQAALRRPIAESGEVPDGLRVPTLGEAFLPQLYRAVVVADEAPLSSEDWWEHQPVRDDLLAFFTRHLTLPPATVAPLLILGQPGSGKSVLAKVLAAQLPPADFMTVLVTLRTVPADAELQDQIEHAIRRDTGERMDWPAICRSAGGALPVVILDGFDELLQATGVSQTDYLRRVAAFQRREADLGRPVAVIVTSRTSVADRAYPAKGSLAVRLEPFDRLRVAAWLDVWNATNAERFASGSEEPLDVETVMRYPDLAAQPLLLLMLALYDAEGNVLRNAASMRAEELYERLLERFAAREVTKFGDTLPRRERAGRIEAELRKLSVVAFAMFNRDAQWVTEAQLEADMRALPGLSGATPAPASTADMRAPLGSAERALGSFFFVHRAQASRGGISLETYEFLHATFGEYLVARLVHGVVQSMVARERASTFPSGAAVDDDLLYSLLSFAPLVGRRQTVDFLRGLVQAMRGDKTDDWTDLLIRLFRQAVMPRPPRAFDNYVPKRLPVPARLAAYTSNLLVLLLCAGEIKTSFLYEQKHSVGSWRRTCILWRSEETASGWAEWTADLAVDRVGQSPAIDVILRWGGDQISTPAVDLSWMIGRKGVGNNSLFLRSEAFEQGRRETRIMCDLIADIRQHSLDPLVEAGLDVTGDTIYDARRFGHVSLLNLFLRTLTAADLPMRERLKVYRTTAELGEKHPVIFRQVIRQMEEDEQLGPRQVAVILRRLRSRRPDASAAIVRCGLVHLDPALDPEGTRALAAVIEQYIPKEATGWSEIETDAAIRLAELGLLTRPVPRQQAAELARRHAARRPDFVRRVKVLTVDD
ncbi:hypothetical protein [Actinoplanes sp. NPDC026619]|uniref:NACHT domain-containing protein n=1 Tax=Actinoplanes sp. NPDC026619 TaxID=3155798 RepID=UPI003406A80B